MSPQRDRREVIPAEREGPERERVAWQRAEERTQWERIQQWREKDPGFNSEGGTARGGIVTLTGCRGTKPPYRVLRRGFTTDILGLFQLVMR